jgi:hypothetical protein
MTQPDPIREYLDRLRASLPVAPREAELILAEAEDHLRETAAAAMAVGMTGREAQEAAISSFGPVPVVARAHEERPGHLVKGRTAAEVLGDLFLAAWKLGSIGLTAIGVSGLVVLVTNVTLGRAFTGQPPAGITFPRARCAYWLAGWPGAHTCAQAAMLEASSDAAGEAGQGRGSPGGGGRRAVPGRPGGAQRRRGHLSRDRARNSRSAAFWVRSMAAW